MHKIARSGGRTMGRALVVVLMTLVTGGCDEGTPDSSRQAIAASSRALAAQLTTCDVPRYTLTLTLREGRG